MGRNNGESVIEIESELEGFSNPDVDESVVKAVVEYLDENGKSYPWDVIVEVSNSLDVPKKTIRKAFRKLHLNDRIVHAEPFVGEMRLTKEN